MDNEMLLDNLGIIKTAMDEYDTMTLNQLSSGLLQYEYANEDLSNEIIYLSNAIRDFDRSKFYEIIGNIEEMLN